MIIHFHDDVDYLDVKYDILVSNINVAKKLILSNQITQIVFDHSNGVELAEWLEGQACIGTVLRIKMVVNYDDDFRVVASNLATTMWWDRHDMEKNI